MLLKAVSILYTIGRMEHCLTQDPYEKDYLSPGRIFSEGKVEQYALLSCTVPGACFLKVKNDIK